MSYPTYLIHYNKNHSKANGQFVSGDGDGDGVVNDHKNGKSSKNDWKKQPIFAMGKKEQKYYNESDTSYKKKSNTVDIITGAAGLALSAMETANLVSAIKDGNKLAAAMWGTSIGVTSSLAASRLGRGIVRNSNLVKE
jgi:hypothetical protein